MAQLVTVSQPVGRVEGEAKVTGGASYAADDPDTAEEALNLIEVEYEELPVVFDPLAAICDDAVRLHPDMHSYEGLPEPVSEIPNCHSHRVWTKGDVDQGFHDAAVVFE